MASSDVKRLKKAASPIGDHELWACAIAVDRTKGADADAQIAERVATLSTAGDWRGVATWQAIAQRLDKLRDRTVLQ